MSHVDQNIEKLIVAHLDGETTPDDELELNRELIRNPDARRMMEAYRRVDQLAGATLRQVIADDGVSFDPATVACGRASRSSTRFRRVWWLVPGAIAAALLALVVPRPALRTSEGPMPVAISHNAMPVPFVNDTPSTAGVDLMRNVALPRTRRDTGREVFGVVGDDGSIYWIEVDRTRTIKRPAGRSADDWQGGPF